jgi:hypothetical protein
MANQGKAKQQENFLHRHLIKDSLIKNSVKNVKNKGSKKTNWYLRMMKVELERLTP